MAELCKGFTAKLKPCSFKATQGEYCKMHLKKINAKLENTCVRIIPDLKYHNHAPSQACLMNCPRYKNSVDSVL